MIPAELSGAAAKIAEAFWIAEVAETD